MATSGAHNKREWNLDDEVKLFNLVCEFTPLGEKKERNVKTIIENINDSLPRHTKPFSVAELWDKLNSLYDIKGLSAMEAAEKDEENDVNSYLKAKDDRLDPKNDAKEKKQKKTDSSSNKNLQSRRRTRSDHTKDEGEDTDLSDAGNEASEKNVKNAPSISGDRNVREPDDSYRDDDQNSDVLEVESQDEGPSRRLRKGSRKQGARTESPVSKKRARSVTKADSLETPRRKHQKQSSPPPDQLTPSVSKRRTRSEAHHDTENEIGNSREPTPSFALKNTPSASDNVKSDTGIEGEQSRTATRRSTRSVAPDNSSPKQSPPSVRRSSRKR